MRYRFLRFPEGRFKAVTFSYDDGCRADKKLAPILHKHGIKGTFNINSDWFGKDESDWHLTEAEIEQSIIALGHEIAAHGAQHKANGIIRPIEGIQDVVNCRLGLEKAFGSIVRGFAYPDTGVGNFHNNTTYEQIKQYLTELDIAYARALGAADHSFDLPSDWHKWYPTAHHNDEKIFELIASFTEMTEPSYLARRTPKLFYIWGHAYEFDNNNNWDRIEDICEKLGGKDDIWYATNIEIYDYVNAYNSLIFSADSSMIYNPTLITVWMCVDGTTYSVKPGETIKIN